MKTIEWFGRAAGRDYKGDEGGKGGVGVVEAGGEGGGEEGGGDGEGRGVIGQGGGGKRAQVLLRETGGGPFWCRISLLLFVFGDVIQKIWG